VTVKDRHRLLMKKRYAVVIEQGPTSWGAYAPDVPGCVSVAETREEVEALIQEAIEFHFQGMAADGDPIPEPSSQVAYVDVQVPEPARQSA
jgi:predicted RNase H-like HicB family nuclease